MGSAGENGGSRMHRRRPALIALIVGVTAVSIVTGAGYWIQHIRAVHHPLYLIKHGSFLEQLQAAADLGVLKDDTDIDQVTATLGSAMDDGEIVLRSAAEESLGSLLAQSLSRPDHGTTADREQDSRRVASRSGS